MKLSRKRSVSDSHVTEGAAKRNRITNTRRLLIRGTSDNLEPGINATSRVKRAKFQEEDVANRLAGQGRATHPPRPMIVGWNRPQEGLTEHHDELVEVSVRDWHDSDDEALKQAIAKADSQVEDETNAIRAKKWRLVADNLKLMNPVIKFGPKACQERLDKLCNGDAKSAPESVQDSSDKTMVQAHLPKNRETSIAAV